MNTGISAINQAVQEAGAFVRPLFAELGKVIVGQTYLVERLVIGLLANGHVLLEGVPGLERLLVIEKRRWSLHWLPFYCAVARRRSTRSSWAGRSRRDPPSGTAHDAGDGAHGAG